jgi:hypothetical protein
MTAASVSAAYGSGSSKGASLDVFLVKKLSYLLRLTLICGSEDVLANSINHLLILLFIKPNSHSMQS